MASSMKNSNPQLIKSKSEWLTCLLYGPAADAVVNPRVMEMPYKATLIFDDDVDGGLITRAIGYCHSIQLMPEFSNFSLEEIRLIDYELGRKKHYGLFCRKSGIVLPTRNRFGPHAPNPALVGGSGSGDVMNPSSDKEAYDPDKPVILRPLNADLEVKVDKCEVILTNPNMFTRPSIKTLDFLTKDKTCVVSNFLVGHVNHGTILFFGKMNVFGANLDEIIRFFDTGAGVFFYPNTTMPPYGEGFHRMAEVTFHNIWPLDYVTNNPIKNPLHSRMDQHEEMLRNHCEINNIQFINYNRHESIWTFRIFLKDLTM